jgi:hypothetical protein
MLLQVILRLRLWEGPLLQADPSSPGVSPSCPTAVLAASQGVCRGYPEGQSRNCPGSLCRRQDVSTTFCPHSPPVKGPQAEDWQEVEGAHPRQPSTRPQLHGAKLTIKCPWAIRLSVT